MEKETFKVEKMELAMSDRKNVAKSKSMQNKRHEPVLTSGLRS
jgi:hypothetical protein